jgi:tRNA (guanine37-N1)-methyltransferase
MFGGVLGESMLRIAQKKKLVNIKIHDLRDWTSDSHKTADDKPFGGGPGMVMKIEPVFKALRSIVGSRELGVGSRGRDKETKRQRNKSAGKIILLTPQGKKFDQVVAKRLAKEKRLVLVCGHYEGVDERIRGLVDEEMSIGDYVLTCGELPAMVLADAVVRLIPGVLGHKESTKTESFENGLLEYPQYTRPAEFEGMKVPQVLLSGNHKKIEEWRREEALKRTNERRPDLVGSWESGVGRKRSK